MTTTFNDINLSLTARADGSSTPSDPDGLYVPPVDIVLSGSFGTKSGYSDHFSNSGVYDLAVDSNFGVVGRWDGSSYVGAGNRFKVVDEGINGKCLKALKGPVSGQTNPNCTLAWTADDYIPLGSKWFSSVWLKHLYDGEEGGQWKYGRWQRVTNSLSDKANETYWNARSGPPASEDNKFQTRATELPAPNNWTTYGNSNVERMPHNKNAWVRMDVLITFPPAYDQPDLFKIEAWVSDPAGVEPPLYTNFTDNQAVEHVNPYSQDNTEWIQHLYQNYLGNDGFTSTNHQLWHDKMFESVGNDWRVEYADNEDWSLRTRSFIQPVIDADWDGDITIPADKFDRGDITNGYLHVIKDSVSVYSEFKA